MIRAIFFDFYGVWAPEKFSTYIDQAQQQNPAVVPELMAAINKYYLGFTELDYVVNSFKFKLNRTDIVLADFELKEERISPALIDFMRGLHGHFLKLGVLANLGKQEYELLKSLNKTHHLMEVIAGPVTSGSPLLSQETFATALHDIGEPPESCLLVSSDTTYLDFGRSLGLQILKFESFAKLQQDLPPLLDQ